MLDGGARGVRGVECRRGLEAAADGVGAGSRSTMTARAATEAVDAFVAARGCRTAGEPSQRLARHRTGRAEHPRRQHSRTVHITKYQEASFRLNRP
jgi:hypothetical protein